MIGGGSQRLPPVRKHNGVSPKSAQRDEEQEEAGIFGQMFNQLEVMYSSFIEVYGMLSKNEEYLEKIQ